MTFICIFSEFFAGLMLILSFYTIFHLSARTPAGARLSIGI